MTYQELLESVEDQMSCAEVALGRMMDIVEEQTGSFPSWDDKAPEWILKNFGRAN